MCSSRSCSSLCSRSRPATLWTAHSIRSCISGFRRARDGKTKNLAVVCLTAAFLLGFLLWGLCKPDDAVSVSEWRKLAQKPELTLSSVLRGEFMTKFETYTLDQFPLRDSFRRLKAVTLLDVLQEKDNNGIYLADGYAAKLDPSIDEASVQHAADRFRLVYDRYLAGTDAKVFAAVIPDKNAFLARQNGYPAYDPAELSALLAQSMPYASMIDLTPALSLDSYYHTDLHWLAGSAAAGRPDAGQSPRRDADGGL